MHHPLQAHPEMIPCFVAILGQTKIKAILTEDGTRDSCTKSLLCPRAAGEGLCVVAISNNLFSKPCTVPVQAGSEALPVRFCILVIQAGCAIKCPLQEYSHISGLPFLHQEGRKGICNKAMPQRWFSSMLNGDNEKICPLS